MRQFSITEAKLAHLGIVTCTEGALTCSIRTKMPMSSNLFYSCKNVHLLKLRLLVKCSIFINYVVKMNFNFKIIFFTIVVSYENVHVIKLRLAMKWSIFIISMLE